MFKAVLKRREKENTTGFLSNTSIANIIVFTNIKYYNMSTLMMGDRRNNNNKQDDKQN